MEEWLLEREDYILGIDRLKDLLIVIDKKTGKLQKVSLCVILDLLIYLKKEEPEMTDILSVAIQSIKDNTDYKPNYAKYFDGKEWVGISLNKK